MYQISMQRINIYFLRVFFRFLYKFSSLQIFTNYFINTFRACFVCAIVRDRFHSSHSSPVGVSRLTLV